MIYDAFENDASRSIPRPPREIEINKAFSHHYDGSETYLHII